MTDAVVAVPDPDDDAVVAEARRLADALAASGDAAPRVVCVAFEGVADVDALATDGADEVVRVDRETGRFSGGAAGVRARAAALAAVLDDPRAVVLSNSPDAVDLAAATARRLRGACVTDALLRVRDGGLRVGRPVYAGRAYAELSVEEGPPVVTLDEAALGAPEEVASTPPSVRTETVDVADGDGIRHVETRDVPEADLERARRVVSGGLGLGDPDGFDTIADLADALGAAVGASRPPADEGWVPFDRQIGVTGTAVDVELYVPCAISGDPYHLDAVRADCLVAINADPEAPIFDVADLGVVGDVYEYGPALAAAVRRARDAEGDDADVGVPE